MNDHTDIAVDASQEQKQSEVDSTLTTLAEPTLDPLFWKAERLGAPSAWWLHVPFAHWIVCAASPGVLVELGTHAGVSYSAFCQAVVRAGLPTRCHAVDTWHGDVHAGEYGESVFNEFNAFNNEHYGHFSTLLRSTFDDALGAIEDASIDLLHIDGLHTYEAVRHDFENWLPKLSDRATVLFHDVNERSGDFGVWRLWDELRARYPSFSFLHGHGLGVVAVGAAAPPEVLALCALRDPQRIAVVRDRFARLGERWLVDTRERMLGQRVGELTAEVDRTRSSAEQARNALSTMESASAAAAALHAKLAEATRKHADQAAQLRTLTEQVAAANAQVAVANAQVAVANAQVSALQAGREGAERAEAELRALSAARAGAARKQAAEQHERVRAAEADIARLHGEVALARTNLRGALARARSAEAAVGEIASDRDAIRQTHEEVVASTAWKATWPLRNAAMRVPKRVRRAMRGAAKLTWWTATLRLPSKLELRRQRIAQFVAQAQAVEPAAPLALAAPGRAADSLAHTATAHDGVVRLVYLSGEPNTPGHIYRVDRFVEAARQAGALVRSIRVDEAPAWLEDIEAATIVVIWRAAWDDNVAASVAAARRGSARIVFDVDDLMIDPAHAQTKIIDGIRSQFLTEDMVQAHYVRVRQTMMAADVCFTTTEELAFHLRWAGKTTYVIPNGFDQTAHDLSRRAARDWRQSKSDGLIRIGYAGGSRTHQRDFGLAAEGIARLLRENAACRLVLFRTPDGRTPLIDVEEFPCLAELGDQVEWRPLQPLATLPLEIARFDINLAPLEFDNVFCEAKSELKFFEAALADVPTVASPTGPFRRAIDHGKTGFLATSADDWYVMLKQLADDPPLRARIAAAAYHSSLAAFGPLQRSLQFRRILAQVHGGPSGADAFALEAHLAVQPRALPRVFGSDLAYERDGGGRAQVTVMVPLYNYEGYIVEALDSVQAQTLELLDLVIVDGFSTDNSLAVALEWARRQGDRFNRIAVYQNQANYGLAFCRNSGFDAAQTKYVLPLDADNKLLPECCARLLAAIEHTGHAFVYPTIQHFGASSDFISAAPWEPHRLYAGNFVDAMALVAKEAWALIGGYDHVRYGWEDFDFWCRLAERGLSGLWAKDVLAMYRVHETSMMRMQTLAGGNYRKLIDDFKTRHSWVALIDENTRRQLPKATSHLVAPPTASRLDALLPILRCPDTGERLGWDADRILLLSVDGSRSWPITQGRPVLAAHFADPVVHPESHISNELPEEALALIRDSKGLVLNLSAGGSRERFANVVEVEYAVFRHTDVVADAHVLPFIDEVFDSIIVMNAFEHYREPHKVAAELCRILKPGGRILIRTAFMQPLHERPWHFFNCTRYGLAEWFKEFETETLHVSTNFCPNHSIAWLASEAESALRTDVSAASAEAFAASTLGDLVAIWRDPAKRAVPLWTDFERLSQTTQEITAAGFEYLGRKPLNLPNLGGKQPAAKD